MSEIESQHLDKETAESKNSVRLIFFKLANEWLSFIGILCRPLILLPIIVSCISLYIANLSDIDKSLALILNIVAAILSALAGGAFYDSIKSITGDTILIKKGISAVRNLALVRMKAKNIYDRVKSNPPLDEISNLLLLIEKDVANSTQEWNDILPGVNRIEEAYNLLSEKETELNSTLMAKEQLENQRREETNLSDAEKAKLKRELDKKEEKIAELSLEVNQLKSKPILSGMSGYSGYSRHEIKSLELAKELDLKPSEVVKLIERIRGVTFKAGTSNVQCTPEEAAKIRNESKR